MASLGETLRSWRLAKEWSLREVERRTGIHNAHLSQIESGVIQRPDVVILWNLATAYEKPIDPLLRLAGHVSQRAQPRSRPSQYGALAWKAIQNLSAEDQQRVIEFMAELKRHRDDQSQR